MIIGYTSIIEEDLVMILSKVLSKYQLTLPKEVVRALHIHKGDLLKCQVQSERIVLTPMVVEEPYSEEELKKFDKLYNDPKNKGKVYKTRAEAMEHLRKLK